jgi:hypothetical protein
MQNKKIITLKGRIILLNGRIYLLKGFLICYNVASLRFVIFP